MDEFLMKPKIDFAFKEIMENNEARKGFLAAVLKVNPKDIKETWILNPYLRKMHEDDKLGILDVRVLLNNDTEIDTEIQLGEFAAWANRTLFYLSKMFADQIEKGQDYSLLKKCVSISILDFVLFKEEETEFYSCFHIREDSRNFLYTDKMEFHVIELPKLPEELKEGDSLLLWAKFINAERKEEFDMLAEKSPYINSAYQHLQVISRDKEKRLEYEAREKAVRDHNQMMKEARERGMQEGRREGRRESIIEVAENFIKLGLGTAEISKGTGLSENEIEGLRKKMK
ncbi:Rpn family recombination-promoting nuclease/putative transposase [bacterium D16-59]|nr:Rpn family recombination-promoting nuclease/putative transposase [bacterium D16-59]